MLPPQGDWLPVRAALHPTGLFLAMRAIPPTELRDPFMQETVARVAAPERVIQIERADCAPAGERGAPAGMVFHVARAGSTLVSQLLKVRGGLVAYSEPLPFNELLLPPPRWPRAELVLALRALGALFARHAQRPYVLKLTSWNTYFCDLIVEAFPRTPWVLCVRDPLEVGVSLVGQTSGWLRGEDDASRQLLTVVDPESQSSSREELVARAYGAVCEAACRLDPARGRLVRYETLPAAAWEVVAPHFGFRIDDAARRRMSEAAGRNAKSPLAKPAAFVGDSAAKRAAASPALRQAIAAFAQPSLQRLYQIHGA
jgi:hypothetical protein